MPPARGGRRGYAPHPNPGPLLALRAAAGAGYWVAPPGPALALRVAHLDGSPPPSAAPQLSLRDCFMALAPRVLGGGRLDALAPRRGSWLANGEGEVHEQERMRGELESLACEEVSRFFTSVPQVSA